MVRNTDMFHFSLILRTPLHSSFTRPSLALTLILFLLSAQVQFNTEAIVPFFTSSAGYGILWDMYSKAQYV